MASKIFSTFSEFEISGKTVLLTSFLLCVGAYFFLKNWRRKSIPGPWGFPVLGYLPLLGKHPHLTFCRLAEKYGSIFGLYLGRTYVVVVSDFNLAKELFNKPALLDRPPHYFEQLPDGVGFAGLSGEGWTEQRRYTIREMKNLGLSGSSWERLVQSEVTAFLNVLKESNGKSTNYVKPLAASFSNNILSLVSGHWLPMDNPGRNIIDAGIVSFQLLHDQSGVITFFPSIFKLAVKLGLMKVKHLVSAMEKMNQFVKNLIEDCKEKDSDNYISNYLKEIESRRNLGLMNFFNDIHLIGNVQALIIGGSHTTKVSMEWLLLAMVTFPDVQEKVHNELDAVFTVDDIACWDDRRKLPYCQAAILEGQRWKTVAPLNLIHRSNKDIEVQGYVIPKNTDVITVLWAFHTDARYWKDPEKFMPERFLAEDGKTIKKIDNFAPFSFGKRICPGEAVAHIELFIYFTAIMRRFKILPAEDGVMPDLSGTLGLTYQPKDQPLRFVLRS